MKWIWQNTTQIAFGKDAVIENMGKFVQPGSKVLCTFGGGSIDHNGARDDVTKALAQLKCDVRWEGGIQPNPDYDRCMEIVAVVKEFQPDLLLAVGGGSTVDATKFISLAATSEVEPIQILTHGIYPKTSYKVASVITLPATGSEWNSGFVISRRTHNLKIGGGSSLTFPVFSLIDPKYTMTLPPRQIRNGVFDALCHVIDQFLTSEPVNMMDDFWIAVFRELIKIGPDVVKEGSSYELHERLIMAASFALNLIFTLGKKGCWGIHMIGHQLTAKYGVDHGASLSICTPWVLETQFERRKVLLAKVGHDVFGCQGTEDEMARGCIAEIRKFIVSIGQATKVSDIEGTNPKPEDIDVVLKMVMDSVGNGSFGINGEITEEDTRFVLQRVVV